MSPSKIPGLVKSQSTWREKVLGLIIEIMAGVCHFCPDTDLHVFCFSGTDKIPLCQSHSLTIFDQDLLEVSALYPIAAISFINTPQDFRNYMMRVKAMKKVGHWLDRVELEEQKRWEEASVELDTLHHNVLDEVNSVFRRLDERLRMHHAQVLECMQAATKEYELFKQQKNVEMAPMTALLLEAYRNQVCEMTFYEGTIRNVLCAVKRDLEIAIKLDPIDDFLRKSLQSRDVKAENLNGKKGVIPEDICVKKEYQSQCAQCGVELTVENSMRCASHQGCLLCYSCLDTTPHLQLKCLCCKKPFTMEERAFLMSKCPGYLKRFQARKEVKKNQISKLQCKVCSVKIQEGAHICAGITHVCLLCVQKRIVLNQIDKTIAECPICREPFDDDIYEEFDELEQNCTICQKRVYLSLVRHICDGQPPLKISCKECYETHQINDTCTICGANTRPRFDWS